MEIVRDLPKFDPTDRLKVVVLLSPPDRRRRDIDNLAKALLDALEAGGLFHDDCQIDDLRIIRDKEDIVKGGKVVVHISTMK